MANRGITNPQVLAAIAAKTVQYYELVSIETVQNTVTVVYYLTNAPADITYQGNTYKAFGQLLGFDTVEENSSFEIPTLKLNISGIAPYEPASGESFLKIILDPTTIYIDKTVVIHRVFLNHDQLIAGDDSGFELYRGYINSASCDHDAFGATTVGLEVSSHWINFDRATGRRTNSNSQDYWYPGDLGFEFSKEVQKEIEWKE